MREFLEDALDHRDAGLGRAQNERRDLPKRFYKDVAVVADGTGFIVTLDGRQTKTPTKRPIVVSSKALADAIAGEWAAQKDHVDPDIMPHTRLVNSAIEGGPEARDALVDEIAKYAGNDLLLYRADTPRELVARQDEVWDPVLVALARRYSVTFEPTVGIIHQAQSDDTLNALRAAIADLDFLRATAMVSVTGLTGSGLLAIAIRDELIDPDGAWTAAHLDEDYQIGHWGEDYEAAARRKRRRIEFDAAVNAIKWLA